MYDINIFVCCHSPHKSFTLKCNGSRICLISLFQCCHCLTENFILVQLGSLSLNLILICCFGSFSAFMLLYITALIYQVWFGHKSTYFSLQVIFLLFVVYSLRDIYALFLNSEWGSFYISFIRNSGNLLYMLKNGKIHKFK